MRPVHVKWQVYENRQYTCKEADGFFHQWGVSFVEFETGPGNSTVAIVELDDGTIKEIYPEDTTFLDKEVDG